jgi:hypothetical protein
MTSSNEGRLPPDGAVERSPAAEPSPGPGRPGQSLSNASTGQVMVAVIGAIATVAAAVIAAVWSSSPANPAPQAPAATASPSTPATAAVTLQPTAAPVAPAEPAAAPTGGVFVLEVTGIGSAAVVTWGTPGGTNQITDVRLPWRKEIRDDGSAFSYASLVASTGTSGGEITCRVTTPDGQVRENSVSGRMAMVSCSSTQ